MRAKVRAARRRSTTQASSDKAIHRQESSLFALSFEKISRCSTRPSATKASDTGFRSRCPLIPMHQLSICTCISLPVVAGKQVGAGKDTRNDMAPKSN